jgi:FkbM family methyltransferase
MFYKVIIKLIIFLKNLLPLNHVTHHKYLNKSQVTNLNVVINSLKNRGYIPDNIFDIGCFHGLWSKEISKIFTTSNFFLYDANDDNDSYLKLLYLENKKFIYKFKLFSDDQKDYKFYKMFSGSSIFEEKSLHPRREINLRSYLLSDEITNDIQKTFNNLIKIDAQGSEIKILKGLGNYIYNFEVIILEVSVHEYNKNGPLFDDVMSYMKSKNYILYDIYDLKRLGENNSFLIQFDCIFVRNNSSLLNVKF